MSFWGVDSLLRGAFLCLLVLVNPISSRPVCLHSPNTQAPSSLLVSAAPLQSHLKPRLSLGCAGPGSGQSFPPHSPLCQVNELHTFGGTAAHRSLILLISSIWCQQVFTSSLYTQAGSWVQTASAHQ